MKKILKTCLLSLMMWSLGLSLAQAQRKVYVNIIPVQGSFADVGQTTTYKVNVTIVNGSEGETHSGSTWELLSSDDTHQGGGRVINPRGFKSASVSWSKTGSVRIKVTAHLSSGKEESTVMRILVGDPPPTRAQVSVSSHTCGSQTVIFTGSAQAGVTWHLQTHAGGQEKNAIIFPYTVSRSGKLYIRGHRASSNAGWGPVLELDVQVNPIPPSPPVPQVVHSTCGKVTMERADPPEGSNYAYYWQNDYAERNSSPDRASKRRDFTSTSDKIWVLLRAKSSAGCWSSYTPAEVKVEQPRNDNYVRSEVPLIAHQGSTSGLNKDKKQVVVKYFDGLGRKSLDVAVEQSPGKIDVVSPYFYDKYGRPSKSYLPYSYPYTQKGECIPYGTRHHSEFYKKFKSEEVAFAEQRFEASPLNRVVEQGAPGKAWALGGQTIRTDYKSNQTEDKVIRWKMNGSNVVNAGYYPEGALYKQSVTDEDNKQTISYTNKEGKVILKASKVQGNEWAQTYYIYDVYNQLRVVLPPLATAKWLANSTLDLQGLAFQYDYDHRDRMIMKKVPGAAAVKMIYDGWDRLVLTQDGNQRSKNEWLFTKYDVLNRPVMTGIMTSSASEAAIRAAVTASGQRFETFDVSGTHQYSNRSYPTSGVSTYLTVTYYDNYEFLKKWPDDMAYKEEYALSDGEGGKPDYIILRENYTVTNNDVTKKFAYIGEVEVTIPEGLTLEDGFEVMETSEGSIKTKSLLNKKVKGQVTGTMVLADQDWIRTASYYDGKYRVIQAVSGNHLGGLDVVSNQYDFIGNVVKMKSSHTLGAKAQTIQMDYTYDHASRLTHAYHTLNGKEKILLYHNEYNAIGELVRKHLHKGKDDKQYAQSLDYEYNIRGWLRSLNKPMLDGAKETLPQAADLFSLELIYNTDLKGLTN